jgi:hypothetical protein
MYTDMLRQLAERVLRDAMFFLLSPLLFLCFACVSSAFCHSFLSSTSRFLCIEEAVQML